VAVDLELARASTRRWPTQKDPVTRSWSWARGRRE